MRMGKTAICMIFAMLILVSCGQKEKEAKIPEYRDGIYTSEAEAEEIGGKIRLTIEVKAGKITEVKMENTDRDGKEKDENYGKVGGQVSNPGLYKIAQLSVKNTGKFPEELIRAQTPDGVDVISGATLSYNAFIQAANDALRTAVR